MINIKTKCSLCDKFMIDTTLKLRFNITLTDDGRLVASRVSPDQMFCKECQEKYQAREV